MIIARTLRLCAAEIRRWEQVVTKKMEPVEWLAGGTPAAKPLQSNSLAQPAYTYRWVGSERN